MSKIIEQNRERDLFFDGGEHTMGRVVFIPKGWCDEFTNNQNDAPSIYGWIGGADVLSFLTREGNEYLTTDAQGWLSVDAVEKMREIDEQEARRIDPDLFTLLDAVNNQTAS